jgi:hypothetical protein
MKMNQTQASIYPRRVRVLQCRALYQRNILYVLLMSKSKRYVCSERRFVNVSFVKQELGQALTHTMNNCDFSSVNDSPSTKYCTSITFKFVSNQVTNKTTHIEKMSDLRFCSGDLAIFYVTLMTPWPFTPAHD